MIIHPLKLIVELWARYVSLTHHPSIAVSATGKITFHLVITQLVDDQDQDLPFLVRFALQEVGEDRSKAVIVAVTLRGIQCARLSYTRTTRI